MHSPPYTVSGAATGNIDGRSQANATFARGEVLRNQSTPFALRAALLEEVHHHSRTLT